MNLHRIISAALAAGVAAVAITACSGKSQAAPDRKTLLADTIAACLADVPGEIGVAVIVDGTDTVTVDNAAKYPMMSVFKLHQALAVADRFDRDGLLLDSLMTISRDSLDPDTWSPMLREHPEKEIKLTVGEVMRYALISSDNNASNLMFERLADVAYTDSFTATVIPRESFAIACTEAEMARNHALAYENRTSPLGAAELFDRLFSDSIVSADKQEFIKTALGKCATGNDRLAAPLAGHTGVSIAHKTGSGYRNEAGILAAHNDAGHITLPDGTRYSIAVLVKDFPGDETQASAVIASVSGAVFDVLTRGSCGQK